MLKSVEIQTLVEMESDAKGYGASSEIGRAHV